MRHLFSEWNRLVGSISPNFPFVSHHVLDIKMIALISCMLESFCFQLLWSRKWNRTHVPGHCLEARSAPEYFKMLLLGMLFLETLHFFSKKSPKMATDKPTINRHYQLSAICELPHITKLTKSSDGWLPNWHYKVATLDRV